MQTAAEHIASLGRKALIVCGKDSAKTSGALDELLEVLQQSKMDWVEFAQVGENPDIHTVIRGKELLVKEVCDLVIAIGGGSPIDAAKAISLAAANDLKADEIYNVSLMHKAYPIIAIPTTAGTGSKFTQYSVLEASRTERQSRFWHRPGFSQTGIILDTAIPLVYQKM
jgi:alcohol dehydrogenase